MLKSSLSKMLEVRDQCMMCTKLTSGKDTFLFLREIETNIINSRNMLTFRNS